MVRITQLQPAQAVEATKKLDAETNAAEIKALAHEMNIAASPDVPASALKTKIIEVQEYHLAKLERKTALADGVKEADAPKLPKKPNLRVTLNGNVVPDKLEAEVDKVKPAPKKKTEEASGKSDTKKEDKSS